MKKGFTLVELSIVLVIIGLLIGGILIGQSLVESAQINKLIREAQSYKVMFVQFENKFNSYAGDNELFTPNGDGNGLIDGDNEGFAAWKHLSDAGFLQETYTGTGRTFDNYVPGTNVPQSFYGDNTGYLTQYRSIDTFNLYNTSPAHWLTLSGSENNRNVTPAFTPAFAASIDNKMDDGSADSGSVVSHNARDGDNVWSTNCTDNDQRPWPLLPPAAYSLEETDNNCILNFRIE